MLSRGLFANLVIEFIPLKLNHHYKARIKFIDFTLLLNSDTKFNIQNLKRIKWSTVSNEPSYNKMICKLDNQRFTSIKFRLPKDFLTLFLNNLV